MIEIDPSWGMKFMALTIPELFWMLMICVDDMFGGTTENVVLNEV